MRVKWLLGIVATAVACTTLSVVQAQQPSTLRANVSSITAGDYPAARAIVNIDATGGLDTKSLTAANFTATVGGKSSPILSADLASSQNAPLDVLLLMDVSGSMAGEPIKQTKDAAKGLVQQLAPNDRVAVMSFADSVKLVQDFTTERGQVDAAIDGLAAKGNTALYDATAAAALKAATSGSSRRAIILLSDGAQDGVKVKTTRDQALAAATNAGVSFFAIGEGKDIDRAYLAQLATASKGRYLEAPKLTDLSGLFATIGQLLTSQFIVTFDASAAASGIDTPITITLDAGGTKATAQATFKPGAAFAAPPITVALAGITAGESLSEPRVVTAVPDATQWLTRVAFYVDGVNVYETAKPPYTFTFDPHAFGAASHTLKAGVIAGTQTFESPAVSFTSTVAAPAPKAASSGSSLPILPIAGGVVLLIVLGLVATVVMRLRNSAGSIKIVGPAADQRITPWVARHRSVESPSGDDVVDEPVEVVEEVGEPMGVLISRGGPMLGSEFVVGGKPVIIGSAARCAVRINDPTLGAEEARIWVRDQHLMVHKVSRLSDVAADGESGGWTILEAGDTLDIGEHRFEFRLWTEPLPPVEVAPTGPVPNVLRDPNAPRPIGPRPATAPASASNLGVIWPQEGPQQLPAPSEESPDLSAQAS